MEKLKTFVRRKVININLKKNRQNSVWDIYQQELSKTIAVL